MRIFSQCRAGSKKKLEADRTNHSTASRLPADPSPLISRGLGRAVGGCLYPLGSLGPKMAVPTRTRVAPSATAISKS